MRLRRESSEVPEHETAESAATATLADTLPGPAPARNEAATPLGELLLQRGALTPAQLAEAIVRQSGTGKRIGELLVELGLVEERTVIAALAEQLDLPLANLHESMPEEDVATLLSESLARGLGAIPIRRDPDGALVVAASSPGRGVEEKLTRALGGPVRLALASATEVAWAINATFRALSGVDQHVAAFTAVHGARRASAHGTTTVEAAASDAPVVKVVDMILAQALRDRASDVHLEPQENCVKIRFRIDGALTDIVTLPGAMAAALASRIKVMAKMNIVERRRPQDGQIAITLEGRSVDVRVSTTGVIWGEKVVLRILDRTQVLHELEDLGMGGSTLADFRDMLRSPYGMVVCAGPTGSGKTTTLYASLNEANSPEKNVTTIEDPVEYVFPAVNQIQINDDAGVTFASGLRSILRQDPDMILVGEIRDVDTANIAVQAALTGHFVLTSVHATDSVSSLYRFIDMGIEPFLISASVLGIVGQRLVRRICPDCREPYEPSPGDLEYFRRSGGVATTFFHGRGCNYCSHTGYSGRVGVYELLRLTTEIKALLSRPGTTQAQIRDAAISQGMQPMGAQGIGLVTQGTTTVAEIIRSIYTL